MVYVPEGGKEQFRVQNWFRNITIGFQPFVPFSQAYRMTLQNEIVMSQSRGTTGYMHYAPKEQETEEEDLHTLSRYPWNEPGGRLDAFRGQGAGRLAAMSNKPFNRLERSLDVAAGLGGQVEMKKLGDDFTKILDSFGSSYDDVTFQKLSSREHQEIMLRMVETFAEEVSLTPQSKFTDRSGMLGQMDPRNEVRKKGVGSEFDIYLEQARSFGDYLEDEMSEFEGEITIAGLDALNLEISRAAARADGKKIFTQFDTSNIHNDDLKEAWTAHLDDIVLQMNYDLLDRWDSIQGQSAASPYDDDLETKYRLLRNTYHTPKAARAHGLSGIEQEWHAEMREILKRMISNAAFTALRSTFPTTTHLWSAPLSNNTAGLTWFYPSSVASGPYVGAPQIGWEESHVYTISSIGGDIVMGYVDWMKKQGHINPIQAANVTARAAIEAANVSVATLNRISMLESQIFNNPDALNINPELSVSMSTLRSSQIAEELGRQLSEYYESGEMKANLRQWYEELMLESDRITNVWKAAMSQISNTMGSSNLHREYIIGDELGNPRKHYLGVWGDIMEPTWKGVGEGSKGDIGHNLSIAPFITSRRRGVSRYGQ